MLYVLVHMYMYVRVAKVCGKFIVFLYIYTPGVSWNVYTCTGLFFEQSVRFTVQVYTLQGYPGMYIYNFFAHFVDTAVE